MKHTVKQSRIAWIDYAKGWGIFSVVTLHVFTGIINAGIIDSETAQFIEASWRYYSFNMPLFFFLGGFFIARSIEKPLRQFLSDRARTLIYPYLLWSLLSLTFGTLVIDYTNSGLGLSGHNLLRILYEPILHYWFLYVIFLVVVSWMLLAKLGISPYVFLSISALLAILINFFDINPSGITTWTVELMELSIYFAVGTMISQPFRQWIATSAKSILLALSVVFLAIWLFFVSQGLHFALSALQPFVSATGMLGVLMACKLLADFKLFPFIELWGRMSLEIYLAHVMAGAAFRILLHNILNIDSAVLNLLGGVFMAMYLPIALTLITRRLHINFLFTLPKATAPHEN